MKFLTLCAALFCLHLNQSAGSGCLDTYSYSKKRDCEGNLRQNTQDLDNTAGSNDTSNTNESAVFKTPAELKRIVSIYKSLDDSQNKYVYPLHIRYFR